MIYLNVGPTARIRQRRVKLLRGPAAFYITPRRYGLLVGRKLIKDVGAANKRLRSPARPQLTAHAAIRFRAIETPRRRCGY